MYNADDVSSHDNQFLEDGQFKRTKKREKKTKQNKHLHDVDGKVSQWCKLARSQQRSSTIGY